MMKKIYTLLLTVLCSSFSYAQDPELFEHTWYLDKIVLENGDEHIPVPNNDVPHIALMFNGQEPYNFETIVCNDFVAELDYDSNISFAITHSEMTLLICEPIENYSFEGMHFGFFLTETNDHIEAPFYYEITTDENDNKMLIITNEREDQAIYGNQQLSTTQFENIRFSVYPNPVSEILHIAHLQTVAKAIVYNINGQQIKTKNISSINKEINVSQLQNGLYFLVLEASGGKQQTIKFLKE